MDRQRLAELHAKAAQARQNQAATSSSAAKAYDPKGLEGTSLGRTASIQPSFNQAVAGQQRQQQEQTQAAGARATNKPQLNLNPPQHMRAGPDRQAHGEQLTAEQKRALALNEALKARQKQQENGKMKDDRERDRD